MPACRPHPRADPDAVASPRNTPLRPRLKPLPPPRDAAPPSASVWHGSNTSCRTRRAGGRAIVWAAGAPRGRAAGPVRVLRGADQCDERRPGEIRVAPHPAPARTRLFTRAAALVPGGGGAAAHASIIAREYGIPAVVG